MRRISRPYSQHRRAFTQNEVAKVLAIVGLEMLTDRVVYMLCPPRAPQDKRHYLYSRGVGWGFTGTLTRTDTKYDTISSALTQIISGQLGPNGRIEPATTTRITNSNDKSNWLLDAGVSTAALADVAGGGPAGSNCIRMTGVGTAGVDYVYTSVTGFVADAPLRTSLYIKRISGTDDLLASNPWGAARGRWTVAFSTLPVGSWVRLDADSSYVTMDAAFQAFADGKSGVQFWTASGTVNFDVAFVDQTEDRIYTDSPILASSAVTQRAADVLRFTGLSGLTTGGALVQLRLPYASTVPAANQYHFGLNGSDSKDNGAFIFTKAADDHLYAELRSGGAQSAEIDLGAYVKGTLYAVAMDWDASGLRAAINGVEKTASGAVTVPASIDRMEVGRGISSDTAHGGETPLVFVFNRALTVAERAGLTS